MRKLWHFSGVILIAVIYKEVTHSTAIQIMALATALFTTLDLLRQQLPGLNQIIISIFGPLMREYERKGLAGTTYLLVGCLLVMLIFPKPIVFLTFILLGTADPLASLIGIRYGKDKILNNKTLQGTLAAFIICAVVSGVYFFVTNTMTERLLIVSLLSGLVGAFSELLPVGKVDDNLTFPLLCSIGMWGIYTLFGGL